MIFSTTACKEWSRNLHPTGPCSAQLRCPSLGVRYPSFCSPLVGFALRDWLVPQVEHALLASARILWNSRVDVVVDVEGTFIIRPTIPMHFLANEQIGLRDWGILSVYFLTTIKKHTKLQKVRTYIPIFFRRGIESLTMHRSRNSIFHDFHISEVSNAYFVAP